MARKVVPSLLVRSLASLGILGLVLCVLTRSPTAVIVEGFTHRQNYPSSGTIHGKGFQRSGTISTATTRRFETSTQHSDREKVNKENDNVSNHNFWFENISIEYCPGCRWMCKAFWMATEILQADNDWNSEQVREVTVIASDPGTFRITGKLKSNKEMDGNDNTDDTFQAVELWERKIDGGFPPIDLVDFNNRLQACLKGDMDAVEKMQEAASATSCEPDDWKRYRGFSNNGIKQLQQAAFVNNTAITHLVIEYGAGESLRAAMYGQELLTTFCEGELETITLRPTEHYKEPPFFRIHLQQQQQQQSKDERLEKKGSYSSSWNGFPVLWESVEPSKKSNSISRRFPEVKELKRLVRDHVKPQKDLGHSEETSEKSSSRSRSSENKTASSTDESSESLVTNTVDDVGDCIPCNDGITVLDEKDELSNSTSNNEEDDDDDDFIDDDEAEEARRYFGVM